MAKTSALLLFIVLVQPLSYSLAKPTDQNSPSTIDRDYKNKARKALQQVSCKLSIIEKNYGLDGDGDPRPIIQQLGVGDSPMIGPLLGGTIEYKKVQYTVAMLGGQLSYFGRTPALNYYVELNIQQLEEPYQADIIKAQMIVLKGANPSHLVKELELPGTGYKVVAVTCEMLN